MPRDMLAEVEARKAEPTEPCRQVLLDAANLIKERGLAKHLLVDRETGALCLHGAINMAARGNPQRFGLDSNHPELAVIRYLRSRGVNEFQASERLGCAGWNNAPERTKEDVVAALRGAAAMSEAAL